MEIVLFEDVCRIEVLNDGELFFCQFKRADFSKERISFI